MAGLMWCTLVKGVTGQPRDVSRFIKGSTDCHGRSGRLGECLHLLLQQPHINYPFLNARPSSFTQLCGTTRKRATTSPLITGWNTMDDRTGTRCNTTFNTLYTPKTPNTPSTPNTLIGKSCSNSAQGLKATTPTTPTPTPTTLATPPLSLLLPLPLLTLTPLLTRACTIQRKG